MAEENVHAAIQVLRARIGGYWQGLEDAGRDEMVAALQDELGYDSVRANDMIDALMASGQVRYHEGGEAPNEAAVRRATIGETGQMGGTFTQGEVAGTPLVRGPSLGAGYWQIGRAGADEPEEPDVPGRKGQVSPEV